jgi:transcriptional regulator with XRE-family HTH domain
MHGGDYISMARRRAGITQRALAERLGCRQATIARWERDDRHPSLEEVQAATRACGFDLAVSLVVEDRSWWPQVAVQLDRAPLERLRSLTPPGSPDLVSLLELFDGIGLDAIVIGEVAGALRGWPLVLSGAGVIEVCGDLGSVDRALRDAGMRRVRQRYQVAPGQFVSVLERPPGTSGIRDLRRSGERIGLTGGELRLAGLLDLLRIAEASPLGARSREALALQAVVEVQRIRL